MTLVDSNVILDLVTNDPEWADWSTAKLEEAALKGPLCKKDDKATTKTDHFIHRAVSLV